MKALTREDAENFLYKEARLIDERRFDEWLELFSQDALYWIPCNPNSDPKYEASIVYDDRTTLASRVKFRLQNEDAHAQSPASRTQHFTSNVGVEVKSNQEVELHSNLIIYEYRVGHMNSLAARCLHKLREEDGKWKISLKKVILLNSDQSFNNLTYII